MTDLFFLGYLGAFVILTLLVALLFHRFSGFLNTPWKFRMGTLVCSLAIHLSASGTLIVLLNQGAAPPGETFRPDFVESCRLYPHIVFFPVFFGWVVLLSLWFASERIWKVNKGFVMSCALVSLVIGTIAMLTEARGDSMMMFEFDQNAATASQPLLDPETRSRFEQVASAVSLPRHERLHHFSEEDKPLNSEAFSFEKTWRARAGWASPARPAYLVMFFYMAAMMCYTLFLSLAYVFFNSPRVISSDRRSFCYFAILAFAVFLLWIPCRIFFNLHTKMAVFGLTTDVNTGIATTRIPPLFWRNGVTSSELLPVFFLALFLIVFWLSAVLRAKGARLRLHVVLGTGLAIGIGAAVLAVRDADSFEALAGLQRPSTELPVRLALGLIGVTLGYWFVVGGGSDPRPRPQVYVSYAWDPPPTEPKPPQLVEEIRTLLKKGGWIYAIDNEVILPGERIADYTADLTEGERIVAYLNSRYLRSEWCMVGELLGIWNACSKDPIRFSAKVIALIADDALTDWSRPEEILRYWGTRAEAPALANGMREQILEFIDQFPAMKGSLDSRLSARGDFAIRKDHFRAIRSRLPTL